MAFIQDLRGRRIVQVVVSYAVTGWVAVQVVGELADRAIIGEAPYRVSLTLFLGGLAAAVVLGWYHGEKGRQQATPLEILLLMVIVSATGVSSVRTVQEAQAAAARATGGTSGALDLSRIGVLYFEDGSGGELGWLADGLTESLIDQLDGVPGVDVVSRSGSAGVREERLDLDSVARIFSAGTLVRGSVVPRGSDGVRVEITLVDGESGAPLSSQRIERDLGEVADLQQEVAREAADLLRRWLGAEVRLRRTRGGTDHVGAWTAFQRAERRRKDSEELLRDGDLPGFIAAWQAADSLFAEAGAADPQWVEPPVMRGLLAARWAYLSAGEDPAEATAFIERGMEHVGEALRRDPRHAAAHHVRGTLHYLCWAHGLAAGPADAESAFEAAKAELEQAVALDPTLAAAWNMLSVVRSQESDPVGANLAARRAYEEDEFLSAAPSVLRALYATSYDLESFRDARRYCDEGHRRFPDDPLFTECGLWTRAATGEAPEDGDDPVADAWALAERYVAMLPERERPYARVKMDLVVAQYLARLGLADSARAVAARAQAPPAVDPALQLLGIEALVHLALGDEDAAMDRLRRYLTASPEHRSGWRWSAHWWWRDLQDNEEFRRLVGG